MGKNHARPTAAYNAAPRILAITVHTEDGLHLPLLMNQVDTEGSVSQPLDISDYVWDAFVMKANSDEVLAIPTVDASTDGSGTVTVSLTPADIDFFPGTYRWLLQATSITTGHPQAILHGPFEVTK